jgi:hypothetical protein
VGRFRSFPASSDARAGLRQCATGGGIDPGRVRRKQTHGDEDAPETLAPSGRDCAVTTAYGHGHTTARREGAANNARRTSEGWRPPGQSDQSSRSHCHPLRELPHLHQLEADPVQSRVQPRPNRLPPARDAPEGWLHGMSHQPGVQQCQQTVRRLPCGYPPPAVWRELRKLPHGFRLARFTGCNKEPSESVSIGGRSRPGGM